MEVNNPIENGTRIEETDESRYYIVNSITIMEDFSVSVRISEYYFNTGSLVQKPYNVDLEDLQERYEKDEIVVLPSLN